MAKKNNFVMGYGLLALMAGLGYLFTNKFFLIALGVVIVAIIVIVILKKREQKPKSLFPQNQITEEAKEYVQKLLDFEKPYERVATADQEGTMIVSEKEMAKLLGLVLSNQNSYTQYSNLVNESYKKALENKEDFSSDEEVFRNQLTFSLYSLVEVLKKIIFERDENLKHFASITNYVERLLYINEDFFKPLFDSLQGFCFWYIYEKYYLYPIQLRHIKRILERNNGIKQTDFYKLLGYPKEQVSFTLYYAELANKIRREKSGRTYQLYLPDTESNQN